MYRHFKIIEWSVTVNQELTFTQCVNCLREGVKKLISFGPVRKRRGGGVYPQSASKIVFF